MAEGVVKCGLPSVGQVIGRVDQWPHIYFSCMLGRHEFCNHKSRRPQTCDRRRYHQGCSPLTAPSFSHEGSPPLPCEVVLVRKSSASDWVNISTQYCLWLGWDEYKILNMWSELNAKYYFAKCYWLVPLVSRKKVKAEYRHYCPRPTMPWVWLVNVSTAVLCAVTLAT